MNIFGVIIIVLFALWCIVKLIGRGSKRNDYNRTSDGYNRNASDYDKGSDKPMPDAKPGIFSRLFGEKKDKPRRRSFFLDFFSPSLPYDNESITWCASLLALDKADLKDILRYTSKYYQTFTIGKRSGGYRMISAPQPILLSVQKTIYHRLLLPVNIHPAATGFRKNISIVNNAKAHLGKEDVLKTDIVNFFGSIKQYTVIKAFEKIGYPKNISEVLAHLCCLNKSLPQGAPTSPALSNIIAYEMDKKLVDLSKEYGLTYTRYADDLTFSGNSLSPETLLPLIRNIVRKEGFALKNKKTRFLNRNKRKIITGVSVSSGTKLTIPKPKKREVRKNVHFILTKGLAGHMRHIKSSDPAYLKRLIGYLHFWHSIEPENQYVINSIKELRKLEK